MRSNKVGDRFGKLVLIEILPSDKHGCRIGKFQCDCGGIKIARISNTAARKEASCGCLNLCLCGEHVVSFTGSHGQSSRSDKGPTPTWKSWTSMMQRCYLKTHNKYKSYGGNGIFVCREWHDFVNFYADMGDRPEHKTLDRIDNYKGYSPENCRWATVSEQNRNKRKKNAVGQVPA